MSHVNCLVCFGKPGFHDSRPREARTYIVSKMGKWFVLACGLVALSGCGGAYDWTPSTGGSGSGGTGGGGSSATGSIYPTFNLASSGIVQTSFLGGLDRRGTGSQVAIIDTVEYVNGTTDRIPGTESVHFPRLAVVLDEYTMNTGDIVVPFTDGSAKRSFSEFPFVVTSLNEIQADGSSIELPVGSNPAYQSPQPFDVDMNVMPGRYTAVQIRLDNQMLSFSNSSGLTFDTDKFQSVNYGVLDKIPTFFSDYVAFDLSNMAAGDRPSMSSTLAADQVYFSGDGIAISRGMGAGSIFELLAPVSIQSGVVSIGPVIAGRKANNTYTLTDTNPSLTKQAALTGVWKPFSDVINASSDVTMVAFPNNADTLSQQLVIYKTSGGKVVGMWEGQVDYDADLTGGNFKLFPVKTVDDAVPSASEQVTGTVSDLQVSGGVVRAGSWTTSSVSGPWTFGSTGVFGVFRK